jgi:hypothetical protein
MGCGDMLALCNPWWLVPSIETWYNRTFAGKNQHRLNANAQNQCLQRAMVETKCFW